jgi:hypothetical protein
MLNRQVGRPPEFADTDRSFIAEIEVLLGDKKARSTHHAVRMVTDAAGIFDNRRQRSISERLRRKLVARKNATNSQLVTEKNNEC